MVADCDFIICGHFHFPTTEHHNKTQLIALGDWINQFSYAELNGGVMQLKTYSPERD
jgi:UDP-2,3-diacylglucosamine hydrolase